VVLVGFLKLLCEIVIDGLFNAIELRGAIIAVAIGFLAFEMRFKVIRALSRDAEGHFNRWLHLSDRFPGV